MIVADAIEGRELIKEKIAKWKTEGIPEYVPAGNSKDVEGMQLQENSRKGRELSGEKRTKPRRGSKRDLRELARSLGLGQSSPKIDAKANRSAPSGRKDRGV